MNQSQITSETFELQKSSQAAIKAVVKKKKKIAILKLT